MTFGQNCDFYPDLSLTSAQIRDFYPDFQMTSKGILGGSYLLNPILSSSFSVFGGLLSRSWPRTCQGLSHRHLVLVKTGESIPEFPWSFLSCQCDSRIQLKTLSQTGRWSPEMHSSTLGGLRRIRTYFSGKLVKCRLLEPYIGWSFPSNTSGWFWERGKRQPVRTILFFFGLFVT